MSAYENVVSGKLKLKGKALDVKTGGVKKKKKHKHHDNCESQIENHKPAAGPGNVFPMFVTSEVSSDPTEEMTEADKLGDGHSPAYDDHLTPAERRYVEQRGKIDMHRLAKTANKSHRDRIQDFNHYLANLSEHYDIPKVGPG